MWGVSAGPARTKVGSLKTENAAAKANIFFMDAKAIRSAPFAHTRVDTPAQPPRPPPRTRGRKVG
jgi:hypothetical protein